MKADWIPCKREMPELTRDDVEGHLCSEPCFVTYLCSFDKSEAITATRTAVYFDDGSWYWGDVEDGMDEICLVEIVAWMPIFEPYKEDA